jgi:hypothetical protein
MMAKMFYTLEETKAALNKNEEEIKQLAREGRLREFRDGPRLMFKSDQVDALKSDSSGGSSAAGIDLGPSDTGMSIGLADSRNSSGSGTGMTLADTDGGRSPGAGMTLKEDTALAADLGLSGSVGGMPSPGRSTIGSGTGIGVSSGTGAPSNQASRSGIDVFRPDEVDRVDPMAQTSVSPHVSEQVNLEGVGSGSGLLDLTRESDDTSLGADLLDEIAPSPRRGMSDTGGGTAMGSAMTSSIGSGLEEPRGGVSRGGAPVYREAADPMAAAFAWAGLGAALMLIFTAFVLTCGLLGWHPDFMNTLASKNFIVLAAGSLVAPVIFFFIGLILGRVGV